jgi:hypothetical protein
MQINPIKTMKHPTLKVFVAACLFVSTGVLAQSPDTAVFGRIRQAEMSSSQIPKIALFNRCSRPEAYCFAGLQTRCYVGY